MNVTVLGSGSRGNALALETDGRALLVDAGFGARALVRRARRVGLDLSTLAGVFLTHEHGDHARGAAGLARRFGCPVYASRGTLRAMTRRLRDAVTVPLRLDEDVPIGPFTVRACRTAHDAAEPVCVAVRDGRGRTLGVAYDLGRPPASLRHLFRHAGCLVVEANHDDALLRAGIAGPGGHLSNTAAATLLAALCHPGLRTVVLAHVSDACNRPGLALRAVRRALGASGFRGRVLVALQDRPLPTFAVAPAEQLSFELV
jgi:phosphoribosyl 1,2-cyclic phosphodiesterase